MEHIGFGGMYPNIEDLSNPNSYRLARAKGVMTSLQKELSKYENVKKKYGKSRNVIAWISGVTGTLSDGLSAAGLGTALTGPGAIVGLPLGVVGGIFGLVPCLSNFASKKIEGKDIETRQDHHLGKIKDLFNPRIGKQGDTRWEHWRL